MPSSARSGSSSSVKHRACRWDSSLASSSTCASTASADFPVASSTGSPVAIRRIRPATRTPKNSSSALAKIAANLTRSSSGTRSSSARSSTRWANLSQLSSRSR